MPSKLKQAEIHEIPEGWEEFKIGDIIDIKHGFAFKGDFFSNIPSDDILLTPGNFKIGGGFKEDKFKYYIGEYPQEYVLKENNIIITMTDLSKNGDTLGYPAKIPPPRGKKYLHNQRLGLVIFKDERIDQDFLYWLMRDKKYQRFVVNSASGSTVKHTAPNRIKEYSFYAPVDINEQRAIAKILSDFDEKIELNQQMNKTLESIAQAIFKRWFVDFEFPGYEKVKFVNGLPEGWRMSKIGEELITVLGGTPARSEEARYWKNGTIPWINSSKANEFRVIEPSEFITQEGLDNSATKLMPEKTTIIAITGATLGQVSLLEISACANQSIVGVLPSDKLPAEFVYFWIKNNIKRLISWQTGGAQQHINKNNVNDVELLCPSEQVIREYIAISKPLFEQIKLNCFESKILISIRDSLLPRLMSGKIRVYG